MTKQKCSGCYQETASQLCPTCVSKLIGDPISLVEIDYNKLYNLILSRWTNMRDTNFVTTLTEAIRNGGVIRRKE